MQTTPIANRLHIGIFGKRNVGKSSLINALTGQSIAIVSEVAGTTTDPVGKTMEISGVGPVYIYDTAGLDDCGALGEQRVARTRQIIRKINVALLVTAAGSFDQQDEALVRELRAQQRAVALLFNKCDASQPAEAELQRAAALGIPRALISCATGAGIDEARKIIVALGSSMTAEDETIVGDIVGPGALVLLVVPIDTGAPKGRLILPQVQTIRDVLDQNAIAVTVKENGIEQALAGLQRPPELAVCDSQVVDRVSRALPPETKFTTFSILYSRLKGELAEFVRGVRQIDRLRDNDRVLIMEACTHHPMPDDIGRIKIPRWIRQHTGKNLVFETNAGPLVNKDIAPYALLISCGGCMINRQEMLARIAEARAQGIPITNYGVAISYVHGVLRHALSPFPMELELLEKG